ncbi:MAG: hypothetical protein GX434_16525 [Peptococcaceae bacterium]|nr:hypothetical protein [Peptococcaceae bacterium]
MFFNAQDVSNSVQVFADNSSNIARIIGEIADSSQEMAAEINNHRKLSSSIASNAERILEIASTLNKLKGKFKIN